MNQPRKYLGPTEYYEHFWLEYENKNEKKNRVKIYTFFVAYFWIHLIRNSVSCSLFVVKITSSRLLRISTEGLVVAYVGRSIRNESNRYCLLRSFFFKLCFKWTQEYKWFLICKFVYLPRSDDWILDERSLKNSWISLAIALVFSWRWVSSVVNKCLLFKIDSTQK